MKASLFYSQNIFSTNCKKSCMFYILSSQPLYQAAHKRTDHLLVEWASGFVQHKWEMLFFLQWLTHCEEDSSQTLALHEQNTSPSVPGHCDAVFQEFHWFLKQWNKFIPSWDDWNNGFYNCLQRRKKWTLKASAKCSFLCCLLKDKTCMKMVENILSWTESWLW